MPAKRFYSLDVLRGIAALCVVFFHWRLLLPTSFVEAQQPLFGLFAVLYTKGGFAVDLFFSLSGFILYWLYSSRVSSGAMSGKQFFILRFSRLFPLHFTTLLVVAAGQLVFSGMAGSSFAFWYNDAFHFALNLLLANAWGLEMGYSFNAPSWSISVEVALYALFFLLCRRAPIRRDVLVFVSAVGLLALLALDHAIGRGVFSFFLGGCVYLTYVRIIQAPWAPRAVTVVSAVTAGLWTLTAVGLHRGWSLASLGPWSPLLFAAVVLFPLTILTLALIETRRGSLGKRIAIVGALSYAGYLWHFPLQLLTVIVVTILGVDRSIFYSPHILGLFIAVLAVVSYASTVVLEGPAQRYIRRRWLTGGLLQHAAAHARSLA
jgi:peptidoglycan/LPS O-acetylase OafA/YrhL